MSLTRRACILRRMSVTPISSAKPLIYLASASPRRSALLTQIGVAHRVAPVAVDESVAGAEAPEKYVTRLAALKADTLWDSLPRDQRLPVLGSDTTVVVDRSILGKPADEDDCVRMLQLLSGRTHQVHTAVAVPQRQRQRGAPEHQRCDFSRADTGGDAGLLAHRRTGR